MTEKDNDPVNHPGHYTSHPSGVECIDVTEHMNFCLGNALKYIWRADLKNDDGGIQDLEKARWYIDREIERRKKAAIAAGADAVVKTMLGVVQPGVRPAGGYITYNQGGYLAPGASIFRNDSTSAEPVVGLSKKEDSSE